MKSTKKKVIVFYDAYCALCDNSILWIIKNDKKNEFYFSHYKSNFAKKSFPIVEKKEAISILTHKGDIIQKSEAIIYLLEKLSKYSILKNLIKLFPGIIRDFFYDIIAKNRYNWFGKYDTCKTPKKEWQAKFL